MAVEIRSVEQEPRKAVLLHRRRVGAAKLSEAERDEAIRRALAAGMTYPRAAEIAGISRQRIDQIRRRSTP